jgi:DNA-binding CsgD family transcriptional regulator
MRRTALVGRDGELATLVGWLDAAGAGEPRLVLCSGDPGVGKTRLAEELTRVAAGRGVPVLWGRAVDSDGAPPFWPWQQVLRAADRITGMERLAADQPGVTEVSGLVARVAHDLGVAADLALLAPEVVAGPADAAAPGGPQQRFRVFDAVTRLLRRLAAPQGLLLVLDDLHWADRASVLLLGHLARDLQPSRLLVMVTYRDTEAGGTQVVAELIREPVTNRLDLRGLGVADVGRQLAALTGEVVAPELTARVHQLTGGNPFFVAEVAGTLADGVASARIPSTVVEAIKRRLDRLSPRCRHQLRAASIVGREFSIALVAAIVNRPVLSCLGPLEEAVTAGLVEPAEIAGQHRFVHALVRDAVEAGLPAAERVRMHRTAARAVEAFYAGTLESHLPDLALHWAHAGDDARAACWAERAAVEAMRRLAYEEAARLYRQALQVQAAGVDADRYRLLLALAQALWHAGELGQARTVSRQAAAAAAGNDRPDLVGEAVLVGECVGVVDWDRDLRASCESALAGLDGRPTAVRARLLARLAEARLYTGDLAGAEDASRGALTMAGECGDPSAVVAALQARQAVCGTPEAVAERADVTERMLSMGQQSGDTAIQALARSWRVDLCFAGGHLDRAEAELQELEWCLGAAAGPLERWYLLRYQGALAHARARFDHARACADEAYAIAAKIRHPAAVPVRHALLWAIAHHTGVDPDAPHVVEALQAGPGSATTPGHAFRIMELLGPAAILVEAGRIEAARARFLATGPVSAWQPPPYFALNLYAIGVLIGIRIGAAAEVAQLREVLTGYRGQHVASGSAVAYYGGPVELYLGLAARYLAALDDAVFDLTEALHRCGEVAAVGYQVEAAYELAAALAGRGGSDDRRRALTLLNKYAPAAARLGMAPIRLAFADLAQQLAGRTGPAPLTHREREIAGYVARGLTNRQIATKLHISERTAENHVQHILTKLGFANRSQIAAWAVAQET